MDGLVDVSDELLEVVELTVVVGLEELLVLLDTGSVLRVDVVKLTVKGNEVG